VRFSYNRAPSKVTGMSSFKVVYGVDPLGPLDLVPKATDERSSVKANRRVEEI